MLFLKYIFPAILIIFLIMLSGLCSFSEMAIASSSKLRLKTYANDKKHRKSAKKVLGFQENYNEVITSIVVFNNVINVLLTTISTVWFGFLFNDMVVLSALFSFVVMTVLIVLFGEVLPKMLAKKYSEKGAMFFSQFIITINFLIKPISLLLKKVIKQDENTSVFRNEDELRQAINEAQKSGITSKKDKEIIQSVLDWDETKANKILIKRKDTIVLQEKLTNKEIIKSIEDLAVTRVPIVNDKGQVTGILNTKKFLINFLKNKSKANIKEYILNFQTFKEDEFLREIFYALKARRQKMGIIINKANKFVGIITIEDILETIVGKIYDEEDISKEGIYVLSDNNILVKPNVKIFDFYEKYLKNNPNISGTVVIEDNNQTFENWIKKNFKIKRLKIGDKFFYRNVVIWIREDKNDITVKKSIIIEIDVII